MKYGRNHYDYEEGTLLLIATRAGLWARRAGADYNQKGGYCCSIRLIWVPLLDGISKILVIFSYDVNEALHLSERERQPSVESFSKIQYELEHGLDKHK